MEKKNRPVHIEELAVRLFIHFPLLARLVHQGQDSCLLVVSHLVVKMQSVRCPFKFHPKVIPSTKAYRYCWNLHAQPVAFILILSCLILLLLCRLPAHTSFHLVWNCFFSICLAILSSAASYIPGVRAALSWLFQLHASLWNCASSQAQPCPPWSCPRRGYPGRTWTPNLRNNFSQNCSLIQFTNLPLLFAWLMMAASVSEKYLKSRFCFSTCIPRILLRNLLISL